MEWETMCWLEVHVGSVAVLTLSFSRKTNPFTEKPDSSFPNKYVTPLELRHMESGLEMTLYTIL